MGLFFLIAGAMTPGAIAQYGPAAFLHERLVRLGLPLLAFLLVLGPLASGAWEDPGRRGRP